MKKTQFQEQHDLLLQRRDNLKAVMAQVEQDLSAFERVSALVGDHNIPLPHPLAVTHSTSANGTSGHSAITSSPSLFKGKDVPSITRHLLASDLRGKDVRPTEVTNFIVDNKLSSYKKPSIYASVYCILQRERSLKQDKDRRGTFIWK